MCLKAYVQIFLYKILVRVFLFLLVCVLFKFATLCLSHSAAAAYEINVLHWLTYIASSTIFFCFSACFVSEDII